MKKILLFAALACKLFSALGQQARLDLSGKITDAQTGQPLSGASVLLADARTGANSNAEGDYRLRNLPAGHHVIEVSYSGYTTAVLHLDLAATTVRDFALVPVVHEQSGIIVTGVAQATNARAAPVSVSILRKAQMLQIPATNVVDLLSRQPGVSQISTGPAVSKPVIRGLSFNRVVVVNDGVRQEGQQWGEEHGVEIDELSLSRAEVLKGPASLIYGSDALGGVVNLITNTPAPEGTVRGSVLTNYQSNNALFGLNGNLSGNRNGFNWNAYATHRSARDYQNKFDGRVLNSRFNENNFGGYLGLNKWWGYSHIIVSSFQQNLGLVEGLRDATTGVFLVNPETPLERPAAAKDFEGRSPLTPSQNVRHYKLVSDNSFRLGGSRLKLNLAYQNNLRKEFSDPERPNNPALFFDLKTVNYNLQLALPNKSEWQTTFGLGGMRQTNANRGAESLIPEYTLFDAGVFGFVQKYFGKTTVSGGLRYDYRLIESKAERENGAVKFAAFQRTFYNMSASIGASHQLSEKLTLKANLARGFRAPTLTELASNGAHEGTVRYEYGTQSLRSEKSLQADAGLELAYDHFNILVSGFVNRIRDYIFYQRLQNAAGGDSLILRGLETFEAFQFRQSHAMLAGFEAQLDLHPHPFDWLHFENTVSFVRGWFDAPLDGSRNLPNIPHARWISELRGDVLKKGKTVRNAYLLLELNTAFAQDKPFTGYNTETRTAGYGLLNAGAGADFVSKKGRKWAGLYLSLNNLTDKAYQDHLNRLKYTDVNAATGRQGVFNAGRNFSVKLNVPF